MDIQGRLEKYEAARKQIEEYIDQSRKKLEEAHLQLIAVAGAIEALKDLQKDEQTSQESTESD